MTTHRHPLAPTPIGYEYARLLCHKLARVITDAAHVVNQDGHYILVTDDQLKQGWYQSEQVVYTADAAHVAAL